MFEVKSKINGNTYAVYAVKNIYKVTMFLTYNVDGWDWVNADLCYPCR
jgi:hypothetical protein